MDKNKHLIINSPYEEPTDHWEYDIQTKSFDLIKGERRRAGFMRAKHDRPRHDDPGVFVPIELVNQIRPRVKQWRDDGYKGATGITKKLLAHWHDSDQRDRPFFFCQLEAIETLIWLVEAPATAKTGINLGSDGSAFQRICSKMATGTGKTIVMAMLIAWQVINKSTYPRDTRFAKNIFIVAPGLTVKSRLAVLIPSSEGNFFDSFRVVPQALGDKLRQGKIVLRNWQALSWDRPEKIAKKKSIDKRGAKSDEAYCRDVLDEISTARNIIVINDEAHHAWRGQEKKIKGVEQEEQEKATVWIGGLDRIHKARGILTCFDFSATPFVPSGNINAEETLFRWIVSDFGLNDAIEAGLVKTPRIVVRDDALPDAKTYKSRLYHIYMDNEVKDDLNRSAEPHEPLPDLVMNAYYLLGHDWLKTRQNWEGAADHQSPPVMITVANRIETAARIEYAFAKQKIRIEGLCDKEKLLRIDSKILRDAEATEEPIADINDGNQKQNKKQKAESLRKTVDTVGQVGQLGEQVQNVISVGMLSEGWDAKTVTHIMGLRAFSSQLLCEQVVGRGLRRTAYEINEKNGLFDPEYVNIFGIPFAFLPHESDDSETPRTTAPKIKIEPDPQKKQYEISWPNIARINYSYKPKLEIDMNSVETLTLDTATTSLIADLAPAVNGNPDLSKIEEIALEQLAQGQRQQKIIFETARDVFDQMKPDWRGTKELLLAQLIPIIQKFIFSTKLNILPPLFMQDELRRNLVTTLNMNKVVQHIWKEIKHSNQENIALVLNKNRSTSTMPPWYTGKPCEKTKKSHINFCVYDSTWESSDSFELDRNPHVSAWAKNDHLGFEILYIYQGIVKIYRPDFIIKMKNGTHLILETKGQDSPSVQAKKIAAEEWVKAVNIDRRFGSWHYAISFQPKEVKDIIEKLSQ